MRPVTRKFFTKDQCLHPGQIGHIASRGQIGLGDLLCHERSLCFFHCLKYWANTVLVHVHTDRQIDFVWIWVRTAGSGKSKNRIGRKYGELL